MAGPVEGIRVVELGVWVAGPAAGGILADWGADVVKIEPPDRRSRRGCSAGCWAATSGVNPPFEMDNRSKRSIVLDLTTADGRDTAFELLADADVFVTNVRPGALQRLGLDFESVVGRNPRLVYGLITGYGETGPDADRAAYDVAAFWSRAGVAHLLTRPGRHAAVPARRHGRPLGGHDPGRGRVRGAAGPRTHRDRSTGDHLAVPPGRLHGELRPQHLPADRSADRDRATRDDGQPVHEQLRRRRWSPVLDRRAGGRPALAARCAAPSAGRTG